jgi:hypothetical protein
LAGFDAASAIRFTGTGQVFIDLTITVVVFPIADFRGLSARNRLGGARKNQKEENKNDG